MRRTAAGLAVGACLAATFSVASCGLNDDGKRANDRLTPGAAGSQALEATPVHRIDSGAQATAAGGAAARDPATVEGPPAPAPRTFAVAPLARIERRALARLRALQAGRRREARLTEAERSRARIGAVRDLTEAVLAAAGLERTRFQVMDGGSTVEVKLDRRGACALQPGDGRGIERQITAGGSTVLHARVRVSDSKLALDRYLRRNCTAPTIPAITDKVLYNAKASGIAESPALRIQGRTWKIDWQSSSALLQIYVYRDGKLQTIALNHKGRGSAVRTLNGPGRFRLRIAGTGSWTVRVLDGAR